MQLTRTPFCAGIIALTTTTLASAALPVRDPARCGAGARIARPIRPSDPPKEQPAADASRYWQELRDLRDQNASPEAKRAKVLELMQRMLQGSPRSITPEQR